MRAASVAGARRGRECGASWAQGALQPAGRLTKKWSFPPVLFHQGCACSMCSSTSCMCSCGEPTLPARSKWRGATQQHSAPCSALRAHPRADIPCTPATPASNPTPPSPQRTAVAVHKRWNVEQRRLREQEMSTTVSGHLGLPKVKNSCSHAGSQLPCKQGIACRTSGFSVRTGLVRNCSRNCAEGRAQMEGGYASERVVCVWRAPTLVTAAHTARPGRVPRQPAPTHKLVCNVNRVVLVPAHAVGVVVGKLDRKLVPGGRKSRVQES